MLQLLKITHFRPSYLCRCLCSSVAVVVTCQVQLQVNENSDVGSDEDDDDNDNDTSASSPRKSDSNLSAAEDKDTETNDKAQMQSATDRLSETQSSSGLTVTPIKIKCRPKKIRTMDRILHLKHNRRRGRPSLTENVSFDHHSFGSLSMTLSPAANSAVAMIRKARGRPKGSKNKVKKWPLLKAKQSDKSKQNGIPLTTDSLDVGNFSSTDWRLTAEEDCDRRESAEMNNCKKSKQTFWRPPADAESRRVLDQISITDITANALTVTIRESTTQDGFFRS